MADFQTAQATSPLPPGAPQQQQDPTAPPPPTTTKNPDNPGDKNAQADCTASESEAERAIKRISSLKNVLGVIIVDKDGHVLRSTLTDEKRTIEYATHGLGLATMARSSIRELDNQNELQMVRIRSQSHELIVLDETTFTLLVLQALKDILPEAKDEDDGAPFPESHTPE